MQINLTVVIQIINFVITYKVLSAFLFKPALASLQAQKERKKGLNLQITSKEQELIALEKEKVAHVVSFQHHVEQTYPFTPPFIQDKPLHLAPIEDKKIDTKKVEKELVSWLVSRVPHDY